MQQVFYSGHGYENPTMGDRQPCTVFNGYEILANPLGGFSNADRERRVFPTGWLDTKVTYGSHALKLGRLPLDRHESEGGRTSGTLAVMIEHGGGRRVSRLRVCQFRAEIEAALLAMPEEALYFLLYSIAETVETAQREGYSKAAGEWRTAIEEKRIRRRKGRAEIKGAWER